MSVYGTIHGSRHWVGSYGGQIETAPSPGAGNGEEEGAIGKVPIPKDKGCDKSVSCVDCSVVPCHTCKEPLTACVVCPVIALCPNYNRNGLSLEKKRLKCEAKKKQLQELIKQGLTRPEIMEKLHISLSTLKKYQYYK